MSTYRISQLAESAGVPATTLRFYEKEGLLPAARTPSGYRAYTDADADRLRFIAAAKQLGLPLGRIRELLAVWDGGMCREIRDELRPMVAAQVAVAERRIAELGEFRDRLHGALEQLRVLPPNDGPCDPACAFLHERGPARPPTIACSLDAGQHDDRVRRWRQLLGDAPREPAAGGGLTVRLPATRAGELADLVVAEQECCPFFAFRLDFAGGHVELTVRAPGQAQPLVDDLFGTAR